MSRLALTVVGLFLSGCDPVVPESYRGEPRLQLSVGVYNSTGESAEGAVPALAYVDDARVSFRPVDYIGAFAADFRVNLYDPPGKERLVPLDPLLAPDVVVAREFIGAVVASRLDEPIPLDARQVPLHPDCWNGGCDFLPGAMNEPCADDDEACLERQRQCPNSMCQLVTSGAVLPEGVEDVAGFSAEYELLYTPEAIPARSWAALKLGAAKGLQAGYHLAKHITYEPDSRERWEAGECHTAAVAEGLARFNAAHETAYDELTLSCLQGRLDCHDVELPEGELVRELALQLTEAEIERGCLELAPDVKFVRDPEKERIPVRINGRAPVWLPSVIPEVAPIVGQEEVECSEGDEHASKRPALAVRLAGYSGSLCPEGSSLDFSTSDGAFGSNHFVEVEGTQRCELKLVVSVPAGYRFRRPIFIVRGFALRESATVPPTIINMSYAMASEPMSSQHVVSGTLDGDFFTLLDTPQIEVPECQQACEVVELDLNVTIEIDSPEGAITMLDTIECQHELGVAWTTCERAFPTAI